MNRTFLFSLLMLSLHCQGQTYMDYDEESRDAYEKAGWVFSKQDSAFVHFERDTTLNAPDSNFAVRIRSVELSEEVGKYQYWLINKQKGDTTKLGTTFARGLAGPVFFWVLNNDYLVYENRDFSDGRLTLRNLKTNQIELDIPGAFWPSSVVDAKNFYDSRHEVLIFIRMTSGQDLHKTDIMKLDLRTRKVEKLMTFDPPLATEEIPFLSLDPDAKILKVKYLGYIGGYESTKNIEAELKY